jgi:hypothetical protein
MAQEILRRLAIAKGQRSIFRPEKACIFRLEATTARFDPHIGRQTARARPQQLRHTRAKMRIRHAAIFGSPRWMRSTPDECALSFVHMLRTTQSLCICFASFGISSDRNAYLEPRS